ncbi:Lys63-specific deubiquitinase [Aureococcus anophagefferens]|nr:Lys63-specific deubiquitinase [Aureococcus anophagefferens]
MGHGPVRVEAMGETAKTEDELDEFLCSIAASWTAESYDLWTKNCNNFSDVVLNFLCGRGDALNGSSRRTGPRRAQGRDDDAHGQGGVGLRGADVRDAAGDGDVGAAAVNADAKPRFVFMGKLLADDSKP